jgi:hypothetical protein
MRREARDLSEDVSPVDLAEAVADLNDQCHAGVFSRIASSNMRCQEPVQNADAG